MVQPVRVLAGMALAAMLSGCVPAVVDTLAPQIARAAALMTE